MDIVEIRGLSVETVIGVYDWERKFKQVVVLDLDFTTDVARAAETDRIADALNYKDVAQRVRAWVGGAQVQLLETLASGVADLMVREFSVQWVRVRAAKPGALRGAREVAVRVERGERE